MYSERCCFSFPLAALHGPRVTSHISIDTHRFSAMMIYTCYIVRLIISCFIPEAECAQTHYIWMRNAVLLM